MAEIGIVASIVQIADLGLRLSLKLYTFGEIISTADKSVISISKDVSLTSSVLKELGDVLEKDQRSRICSENAVQTANGIVQECLGVFEEMDGVLVKKLPHLASREGEKAKRAVMVLERLKWPYLQPKLELMRCNLEKLKSTLNLMLNVITLARQQNSRTESPLVIEQQKTLVEDLARSNVDYVRRFEQMQLSVGASQPTQSGDKDASMTRPNSTHSGATSISNGLFHDLKYSPKASSPLSEDTCTSTKREGPESDGSDFLALLLSQHYALVEALLQEVDAPKYRISFDSRSRIKRDVITSHSRETDHAIVKHRSPSIQVQQLQNLAQKYLPPVQEDEYEYFARTALGSTAAQQYPGATNFTPQCWNQQSTSDQNVGSQELPQQAQGQPQPQPQQYHPTPPQQIHQQIRRQKQTHQQMQQQIQIHEQMRQQPQMQQQLRTSNLSSKDGDPNLNYPLPNSGSAIMFQQGDLPGPNVSSEQTGQGNSSAYSTWQGIHSSQQQQALVDQPVTMNTAQKMPTPPGISRSASARGQKRSRSPEPSELHRSSPMNEGPTQRDGITVKTSDIANHFRARKRSCEPSYQMQTNPFKRLRESGYQLPANRLETLPWTPHLPLAGGNRVVDDLLALWTLPTAQEATD